MDPSTVAGQWTSPPPPDLSLIPGASAPVTGTAPAFHLDDSEISDNAGEASSWRYPIVGALVGGVLGAALWVGVLASGGGDFVEPALAVPLWTLGASAVGAAAGLVAKWIVD